MDNLDHTDELVPCPTCWLPADLVPAGPHEDFPHAKCARGHDNSLIPAVLEHLRAIARHEAA